MTIKHLTPVLFGLILSSGLTAASATAQPPIGLDRDIPAQNSVTLSTASTQQLERVSDFLLQLVYFGLPSTLIFAVLIYNQRKQQQTQLVAQLVRIRDKK
ncbi:hypothetical protein [Chamaesiphon minutus]|uniref:CcmD family protein n=1 Tax=Chamaesiphon minutus (strain ATCC 27169 / PCC 6605) TaxID=1173020 RepID=K9UNL9_CHAP6|nr:hypothetical protein [Chamaesiphon minutus]AFY96041.1 hypothetical protein Cha6605_5145 [Chamaesiphon minutus PCC 6605]